MALSKEEFLVGINFHNKNAYKHIYQRYYQALVIYAMGTIKDQDRCEDIVQELIIAMWQRQNNFQSVEQLESYLYNSVHNRVVNEVRHMQVRERYASYVKKTETEEELDGEQTIEDLYAQLFYSIQQLPEKQQRVILLGMEGKSNADIAEILNLSIETVKTHRKLALKRLREITRPLLLLLLLL